MSQDLLSVGESSLRIHLPSHSSHLLHLGHFLVVVVVAVQLETVLLDFGCSLPVFLGLAKILEAHFEQAGLAVEPVVAVPVAAALVLEIQKLWEQLDLLLQKLIEH